MKSIESWGWAIWFLIEFFSLDGTNSIRWIKQMANDTISHMTEQTQQTSCLCIKILFIICLMWNKTGSKQYGTKIIHKILIKKAKHQLNRNIQMCAMCALRTLKETNKMKLNWKRTNISDWFQLETTYYVWNWMFKWKSGNLMQNDILISHICSGKRTERKYVFISSSWLLSLSIHLLGQSH